MNETYDGEDGLMKMHADIAALKGSTVTLGPILTDLNDAFARHVDRVLDDRRVADSSLDLLRSEQRAIVENAGISLGLFNAVLRSRVSPKWLRDHGEWACPGETGCASAWRGYGA